MIKKEELLKFTYIENLVCKLALPVFPHVGGLIQIETFRVHLPLKVTTQFHPIKLSLFEGEIGLTGRRREVDEERQDEGKKSRG